MKRNYALDLMRVFLSICVIATHSLRFFGLEKIGGGITTLISLFLIQSDGAFYMLSGYFNLEKTFDNSKDIIKFYKSKVINTLLPFVGFIFAWHVWDYLHVNETFDLADFFSQFYIMLMNTSCDGHLWFMYPLIGLLLSTPFLSKMLHNMDEKELKILWYVALGWNVALYYLCYDLGVKFRYLSWFLDGWPIYYIGGYYYRHVIVKENKIKWLLLGIIGYVGTWHGLTYLPRFSGATDIQPLFTLFTIGCLLFWDQFVKVKTSIAQKVIVFLSSNTFLIYLFHMRAMEYALRKFNITTGNVGGGLLVVLTTFLVSLLVSYVVGIVMKIVQRFIDKIWAIN